MIKIIEVEKGSVAEELGINVGDYILKINGITPRDNLDMIYFDSLNKLKVIVLNKFGIKTSYFLEKETDEKLGICLKDFEEIKTKWCANKCIFCFVDQLPKNLRKTLYVKDDDWRLSFISGNYVTLTNLTGDDIKRICKQKFSPLYVSVHATDEKVRRHLLGRTNSLNIMSLLKRFARNKIVVHAQAVVCPGINDGEVLEKTIKDLLKLYPYVKSLAVVPVGLTCHRNELAGIKPFDHKSSRAVLEICGKWQKYCKEKYEDDFVYPSDELYLKADMPFPDYQDYGEFEQIENGVGLVPKFEHEFLEELADSKIEKKQSYTLITGVSASNLISSLTNKFKTCHNDIDISVVTIKNEFFGESVSVAGLIVGRDIANQTKGMTLGDVVVIPKVMMKETENVFLDGTTLEELETLLKRPIKISGYLGSDLVKILCGKEK